MIPVSTTLVFATRNVYKISEFNDLARGLGLHARPLSAVAPNAPDVDETGSTFIENAALKAISAYRCTGGLAAIADDSGICVDALGGGPGIHSARFAGPQATDEDNNRKLLTDMSGQAERTAHYFCALVMVCPRDTIQPGGPVTTEWPGLPADAVMVVTTGRVDGLITDAPAGSKGFGYDPYFYVPELECTFAQVPADVKHGISHRGKAFRALIEILKQNFEE
jgi:XTP/dITP diphosphohydrolase